MGEQTCIISTVLHTHARDVCIQWDLSNPDTNGADESVVVSEVSSFQRLKCMQEWTCGGKKCPVQRGVPSSGVHLAVEGSTVVYT